MCSGTHSKEHISSTSAYVHKWEFNACGCYKILSSIFMCQLNNNVADVLGQTLPQDCLHWLEMDSKYFRKNLFLPCSKILMNELGYLPW